MPLFEGQCTCGEVAFEAKGAPLFRALCHCSICRAYHQADWGDIAVFREKNFVRTQQGAVTYRSHMSPPLLQRGHCASCSAPILEKVNVPALPNLRLVPTRWLSSHRDLPDPAFHLFYEMRQQDFDDDLPKAHGYWRSQLQFCSHLIKGLMGINA